MEGEHRPGARLGVEAVGEVGLDAGGFVEEGQRSAPGRQTGGQASRVTAGLEFDAGQRGTLLLGFEDTGGPAVDVEQVIGETEAGFEREFAQRDAARGVEVGLRHVTDMPTRLGQQPVDFLPCLLFRLRHDSDAV